MNMGFIKHFLINALIVLGYFLALVYFNWNVSGGDIVIWMLFIIIAFFHLLVISAVYLGYIGMKWFLQALFGLLLGCFFSFLVFKGIEYYKCQNIKNEVIQSPP